MKINDRQLLMLLDVLRHTIDLDIGYQFIGYQFGYKHEELRSN